MAIEVSKDLVAACGLYCGSCAQYIDKHCPGCRNNEKAAWCKVRVCCRGKKISTCADCTVFANAKNCVKFNNFISKVIGLLLNSDRAACLALIREKGYDAYAGYMAEHALRTIRKR